MTKYFTLAVVLFGLVAAGHCYGAGPAAPAGPAVQQVSWSSVSQLGLGRYLNDAPAPGGYQAAPAPAAAPAQYAPARYVVLPGQAPAAPVAVPVGGYGGGRPSAGGYGGGSSGPRVTVQSAWATQLNPGPTSYRKYIAPPQYSTVALPIIPSSPVARLYVPDAAAPSAGGGYASLGGAAPQQISIGGSY